MTRVFVFIGYTTIAIPTVKQDFYASPHAWSVLASLRSPCPDEAWQFQEKKIYIFKSTKIMAKQPKCSCDKTPMHIHPQVIVRSLTVTWLNNYVAQHNILVFKNACVSFFPWKWYHRMVVLWKVNHTRSIQSKIEKKVFKRYRMQFFMVLLCLWYLSPSKKFVICCDFFFQSN